MSEVDNQTENFSLGGEQMRRVGGSNGGGLEADAACVKVLDFDGRLLTVNSAGLCLLEIDDFADFKGRAWADFWVGEQHGEALEAVAAARRGAVARFEGFADTAKGTRKYWEVVVAPILGADGQPRQILAISRDVTEQWAADQKLKEAERRYRLMFDSLDEGFCLLEVIFDGENQPVDHRMLEVNPAFEKMTGISAQTILSGKTVGETVPDIEQHWNEVYGRVVSTGISERLEQGSDALGRWFSVHVFRIGAAEKRQLAVLFKDISQRKTAESALFENRRTLETALKAGKMGSWTLDLESGALDSSEVCKTNYGRNPSDEFTYQDLAASILPEDRVRWQETIDRAVAGCSDLEIEYRVRRLDDSIRWILVRGNCFANEAGKAHLLAGVSIDISDRKSLEEQIIGQSEVLEAVALGKPFAEILNLTTRIIERQLSGSLCSILLANEAETHLFGGAAQSLPDEYNRAIDGIAIGERTGSCGTASFRRETVIVADIANDPLWADFRELAEAHDLRACWSQPIFSPAGQLYGTFAVYFRQPREPQTAELALLASAARISGIAIERHRAEEAVRQSEEKFRTLADNIAQLAWMTDADGSINWYNKRWYDYTGTTFEEMQGWGWQAVHAPEEVERVIERFRQHLASGEIWEDTFPLRSKNGEYRWFLSRALPIRNHEGEIVSWFGTNTDIEEVRRARVQAESANRLKDEFLATVSHELRTPLNAILGWSQMLQSQNMDDVQRDKAVATIYRSAKSQNQLIEDILDVSRIITGKLRLDVRAVDLPGVIAAAADVARPAAEAKNIRLQVLLDPQAGPISGDPDRLQQVVWNMLSNAVKFTPKGGRIQVRLERVNSHVEIVVSDTGKGIEAEFLPHVFDRFRQSDGSMTRRHGGLGLGLAIVRQIVELHGGTVFVMSDGAEKGATFTISLPILPLRLEKKSDEPRVHPTAESIAETPVKAAPDSAPELEGLKILLVDDEADTRDLLKIVLLGGGAEVVEAASAAEAFAAVRRDNFDVLISDIGMPDEDGFSLIGRIRSLSDEENGGVPAIALTAYARSEDRVKAIRAGFQMHIAKPVEPAELVTVAANLAGRTRIAKRD